MAGAAQAESADSKKGSPMATTRLFADANPRLRRIAISLLLVVAGLGASTASAQARASLTVGVHTVPAGDPAVFTFHVTGPTCPGKPPTDVTLKLHDGQSIPVPLCHGDFTVMQEALDGWKLVDIQCVATPPDPQDPFIIDVPGAKATIELSPDEHKACEFTNERVVSPAPPAPPGSPSPSPSPGGGGAPTGGTVPVTGQRAPKQAVLPTRVVAARASLRAPTSCVDRRFTVSVAGGHVRSVAFAINGKVVRTLRARTNQRRFTVTLPARTAVSHVVVRVSFTAAASPRTRTLRRTIRRCTPSALAPNFTG